MKKFLIHSLLKTYSYLIIAIVIFVAMLVSYSEYTSYMRGVEQAQQRILDSVTEDLTYYQRRLKSDIYHYSRDKNKLEGISSYFQLSPSDYQLWLSRHPLAYDIELSFHNNINRIYLDNDFVERIDIALVGEDDVFTSQRRFKSGLRIPAKQYKAPDNSFPMTMYDPMTSGVFATVFIAIDTTELTRIIETESDLPISVLVTDSLERTFFQNKPIKESLAFSRTIDDDIKVSVGLSKSYLFQEISKNLLLIFISSFLVIVVLLALLKRIFAKYEAQVGNLVGIMEDITDKDSQIRIDTTDKEQEFLLISSKINAMLDSLDKTITENYQLQLAQKDANMRALQAQINPHFLYNTLEFLRMYAVTRDQEELADIIYEFAALLRGSISQEKETTIAAELDFCEKHSFICQIRYPKSIAYAYQIDKGCEPLVIPRFSLQPLVENYFVHGVDLSKMTNALSVKVLRSDKDVTILIRDNGKGMPTDVLERYRQLLKEREVSQIKPTQSIGILNVHERFLLHFGPAYSIELSETKGGGVTYRITLANVLESEGRANV